MESVYVPKALASGCYFLSIIPVKNTYLLVNKKIAIIKETSCNNRKEEPNEKRIKEIPFLHIQG